MAGAVTGCGQTTFHSRIGYIFLSSVPSLGEILHMHATCTALIQTGKPWCRHHRHTLHLLPKSRCQANCCRGNKWLLRRPRKWLFRPRDRLFRPRDPVTRFPHPRPQHPHPCRSPQPWRWLFVPRDNPRRWLFRPRSMCRKSKRRWCITGPLAAEHL